MKKNMLCLLTALATLTGFLPWAIPVSPPSNALAAALSTTPAPVSHFEVSPPAVEWSRTFGGVNRDWAYAMEPTTDGGYILVGFTSSSGAGNEDVYLVKTDSNGNQLWTKTYGGSLYDFGYDVRQTTDGGYIVAGATKSFGSGDYDVYLIKTDSSGNMTWSSTFGGSEGDEGYGVEQTTDGGYIIACAGTGDFVLIKTDAGGHLTWKQNYGASQGNASYSVQQTADGGYIVTGETYTAGSQDVLLLKTDASGNMTWSRAFGGADEEFGRAVQQTADGGYIIAGLTDNLVGTTIYNMYLIKTDASGNLSWSNEFGGANQDYGHDVRQTVDGGYIVTGADSSEGAGSYDIFVVKTDASGNKLWGKTIGGAGSDQGYSVRQTTDGGYVVAGFTTSFGAGDMDFYLVKLAADSVQPLSVTTGNATNITSNSALLRGELTSLGISTSANVSFQWGIISDNYTHETPVFTMNSTGSYSTNVIGLTSNTTHYFRAKVTGDGTSYGVEKAFTTSPQCESPPPFLFDWGSQGDGDGQFQNPDSIAVDSWGNLYVADGSNRVQKFSADGVFLTKWGSPGTGDGQFYYPTGIAIDTSGTVYVADTGNNRVQKFSSNGTFIGKWGLPGSADGQFQYPEGIAVDTSGIVYVADTHNDRVQMFTSNGIFVGKLGSPGQDDGQLARPGGVAVNPLSEDIFIADTDNSRIQKFTSSGGFITKWGGWGLGDGQMYGLNSIAVTPDGNIYVADYGNHRVQKFTGNGAFITKWGTYGTGDGQFQYARSVAVNSVGNVYVVDFYGNRIQVFGHQSSILPSITTGNATAVTSTSATLNGVLVSTGNSSSANVSFQWGIISDNYTHETPFVSMNTTGAFSANITGLSANTTYYFRAKATGEGMVYGIENAFTTSSQYGAPPPFFFKWGTEGSGNGQFNNPTCIVIDAPGNVYIVDYGNQRIQKFTISGTYVTKWGSLGSGNAQLYNPWGAAVDASGNIYVTEDNNNRIQKFTGSGSFIAKWGSEGAGDGQFNNPTGIAVDASGNIYVADTGNNRIQKLTGSGSFVTKWGTLGTADGQFNRPFGVAVDASGNVYVTEDNNNRIQKFTGSGSFITKWGTEGSGDGQFEGPMGVAVNGAGNIFVTDGGNNRVQIFTGSGEFVNKWGTAGTADGQFRGPYGVAVDASGNVYVVDINNARIQVFGTALPIVAPTVFTNNATGITGTSAILRGTLTAVGTATSSNVSFQWGPVSGNYSNETAIVSMNSTSAFSANITGLSANTTYYYRAKAVGNGTAYGNELSFITSPEPPSTPPVLLPTVKVNSGTTLLLLPAETRSNIPVTITDIPDLGPGNGVGAFTFDFTWNKNVINVDNITTASLPGFAILAGQPDNNTGTVAVAGFSTGPYLTGNITVAYLSIRAAGSAGSRDALNVSIRTLVDKDAITIAAHPMSAPVVISSGQVVETDVVRGIMAGGDSAVLKVRLKRIKDPDTGLSAVIPGGVANFSARLWIDGPMQIGGVRGFGPFQNMHFDNATGRLYAASVTSFIQPDNTDVAEIIPILTGNTTTPVSFAVIFEPIGGAGQPGYSVPAEFNAINMGFRRGNANQSNDVVDIGDALFIAQYIVGQRPLNQINALNAASVAHDGVEGDKITIGDALFIAQYLVGQRNTYFQ